MPDHSTTRKELAALERAFVAEIENRLPFQSKAKVYADLCEQELLAPMRRILGGRIPIVVEGYQLTHAGRFLYCMSCDGAEDA